MKRFILLVLICLSSMTSMSQEWMTNLDIAKRLAMVQDKMLLMIWEDASMGRYPVSVYDENGKKIYVRDLFENELINKLIWEHFVPVVVSESVYSEWYDEIKNQRSVQYMMKFEDDTLKVMDVNGNILNIEEPYYEILNISEFIARYYLDTTYLKGELLNYSKQKDVYTTFRLAAKYIDLCIFVNPEVKDEMLKLSSIYLNSAKRFLTTDVVEDKQVLEEKIALQELKQFLIEDRPRRVLRELKKASFSTEDSANKSMIAFLNFTAHLLLKDEENASAWRDQLTTNEIKKANIILRQK